MSFTATLIDARECVQVDNDSIFVYKVSPHLSNGTMSSFPHFLCFCKDSSQWLRFPQDDIMQRHDLYIKFSLLTFTGQYGPFFMLLLFRSMNPFMFHSCQQAYSHIELHWTQSFFLLTIFHMFLTCFPCLSLPICHDRMTKSIEPQRNLIPFHSVGHD